MAQNQTPILCPRCQKWELVDGVCAHCTDMDEDYKHEADWDFSSDDWSL